MGIILDTLRKTDPSVKDCTAATIKPAVARNHVAKADGITKDVYPTGNDTFTPVDALGSASGDVSSQSEEPGVDVVNLDATLFDQKVRELVQGAGHAYNFKAAKAAGLVKRVNPELVAAVERVQKNAGFLNRLVALTNARKAHKRTMQTQPSASGSASGSTSGVSSDDVVGGDTMEAARKFMAGDREAGLRLMKGRDENNHVQRAWWLGTAG